VINCPTQCQNDSDCGVSGCGTRVSCQGGQCTTPSSSCNNQCAEGQTRCAGAQVQACRKEANGCTNWGTPYSCPAGATCQGNGVRLCKSSVHLLVCLLSIVLLRFVGPGRAAQMGCAVCLRSNVPRVVRWPLSVPCLLVAQKQTVLEECAQSLLNRAVGSMERMLHFSRFLHRTATLVAVGGLC
jgi:hypothetical protein